MHDKIDDINIQLDKLPPEDAINQIRSLLKQQQNRENAVLWFLLGKFLWKLGKNGEAISAFTTSVDIDPNGPGKIALEMANQITEYYNPDLMNP